MVDVDRDTNGFQSRKHPLDRQLHVGQQARRLDTFEFDVKCIGEVDDGTGTQHLGLSSLGVTGAVVIE